MIAALAGRRIDAPNAKIPRFPTGCIGVVRRRIRQRLEADGIRVLVCAAACGADLLALSAAAELRLQRRVVLPFAIELFRERSVVDRPGAYPWGELFDRFVREAEAANDLTVLSLNPDDPNVFESANEAILDDALSAAAAGGAKTEALVVWDSALQTGHDLTAHFALAAERRGIPVDAIGILETG